MTRQRGERGHDNPTGLELDLSLDGFIKGSLEYRREYSRRYYHLQRQKPKAAAQAAQYRYGLSPDAYSALWEAADGKCQCCGREVKPSGQGHAKHEVGNVDHCHTTGKVRGILCNPCNQALGLLNDRPELAVAYLKAA